MFPGLIPILLEILLHQASIVASSESMDICSAIDYFKPLPILSVFHYPPTKSIVFLLSDDLAQSVPVSAFNITSGTLSLIGDFAFPKKVVGSSALRCCKEPPIVNYHYIEILPRKCLSKLTSHYRVTLKKKSHIKSGSISENQSLYFQWQLAGHKELVINIDSNDDSFIKSLDSNKKKIVNAFCSTERFCSLVTDPVNCQGYHFSKSLDHSKTEIEVRDLETVAKNADIKPDSKFLLQSHNFTHLKFNRISSLQNIFSEQLPLGFILNETVVLFSLRSSEVYILQYTPITRKFINGQEMPMTQIILRTSMAKFFKCPNKGGGETSSKPKWTNSLGFQLSAVLVLIAVLTILVTLCVRAIRRRQSSSQIVAGAVVLPEITTVSRQSSYSHIEGDGGNQKHRHFNYLKALGSIINSVSSSSSKKVMNTSNRNKISGDHGKGGQKKGPRMR